MSAAAEPFAFSGPVFRLIAPPLYLRQHLTQEKPARPSGRGPSEARSLTLTTNSLSHAHGSAVVRAGDTAVVCGVRGEVLTLGAGDDPSIFETYRKSGATGMPASSGGAGWGGLVVPNIEMSTGCSKNYPLGPPGDFAQTLAHRINDLLQVTKIVDLKSLRIHDDQEVEVEATTSSMEDGGSGSEDVETARVIAREVKGYWTLYLDVLCISLDGNVFDVAWMAILAALSTAKLPKAAWNVDASRILCSTAPELQQPVKLRKSLPFATTFAGFSVPTPPAVGQDSSPTTTKATPTTTPKVFCLADPDAFEESEASEFLTVVVSLSREGNKTNVERMEKSGGKDIGVAHIKHCIEISGSIAKQMGELLVSKTTGL